MHQTLKMLEVEQLNSLFWNPETDKEKGWIELGLMVPQMRVLAMERSTFISTFK